MTLRQIVPIEELTLLRYPEQSERSTLQAWDSADEYLLEVCKESVGREGSLLLINDSFGALSCALAYYQPVNISDSYITQQATRLNLQRNGFSQYAVSFIDCLAELPKSPSLVLIKIPKTLSLLSFQLECLSRVVSERTVIIAGAKAQDIHTSTLQLFEKWLGVTTTSLAKKKSRLIFCCPDGEQRPKDDNLLAVWSLAGTDYQISNYPGVFSRESLDIGARFFINHLPEGLTGTIADLGCGNGVVGLTALAGNPQAELLFVDESYLAVTSAQRNVHDNRPDDEKRCQFRVNDSLSGQSAQSLQAVLCNPPFHQQRALTSHIAKQMFCDAKRCLIAGGELRIVANRHLDYYHFLKKLFGNCETVAANSKFVVLRSVKM